MAQITLSFNNPLNVSLQFNNDSGNNYPGADIIFFQDATDNKIYEIGPCINITNNTIICEVADGNKRPEAGDFIFFAKNTEANTSGIIGYYAEVEFEITSTEEKELYAVNSEIALSS